MGAGAAKKPGRVVKKIPGCYIEGRLRNPILPHPGGHMLDFIAQINTSIFIQSFLFLAFVFLVMRLSWKLRSPVLLSFNIVKYSLFILVFIYLFSNWASDVNPTLRNSSVVIISLINIYMLWQVIVTGFEVAYQGRLKACVKDVCNPMDVKDALLWGRRYYSLYYFWRSFTSGGMPWVFLRAIAAERTRDDLHRVFMNADARVSIFNFNLYDRFLRMQLVQDLALDEPGKSARQALLNQMAGDGWLRAKSDEFLHRLIAEPEKLLDEALAAGYREVSAGEIRPSAPGPEGGASLG
jgi:hypothetical protein